MADEFTKAEIGMEKLLGLLNEYAHTYADHYDDTGEEIKIKFLGHYDQCFHYTVEDEELTKTLVDDVVISKRYGFVGWLIENKKLKSYRAYRDFISQNYVEFENGAIIPSINGQLYDSVLCGLAIQDEPIRFLCEILH